MNPEQRAETQGMHFIIDAEWYDGPPAERDLLDVLHAGQDQVTGLARTVLGGGAPPDLTEGLRRLTWGVRAYLQFQDVMGVFVASETPAPDQQYCYYRSLMYMRESVLSGLSDFPLAACASLREALELAVSHLYWQLESEEDQYKRFYEWLLGSAGRPSFTSVLDSVFGGLAAAGDTARADRLREATACLHRAMSPTNCSPRLNGALPRVADGSPGRVPASLHYFIVLAEQVLSQLVHTYLLFYPVMLFPVDLQRKWGFDRPVGLLADTTAAGIVEQYVGGESADELRRELADDGLVCAQRAQYEEMPDLSKDGLEAGWDRFCLLTKSDPRAVTDPGRRHVMVKRFHRATVWTLNCVPVGGGERGAGPGPVGDSEGTLT